MHIHTDTYAIKYVSIYINKYGYTYICYYAYIYLFLCMCVLIMQMVAYSMCAIAYFTFLWW